MKLISCILILATLSLCFTSVTINIRAQNQIDKDVDPIFVVLDSSELRYDKPVSSLVTFGANKVLANACSSQPLFTATDFQASQIQEVSKWSDESSAVYKFTVRQNHVYRPEVYIESKFTVQYLSDEALAFAQRSSIIFSEYNIMFEESATLKSAYRVIPSSQYSNSRILQLLSLGNEYVCQQAKQRNQLARLPTTTVVLDVLEINKIAFRKLDNIVYYSYDVVFGDASHKNYKVKATFIVMVCKNSGKYSIVSVKYNLRDLVDNKICGQLNYDSDSSDYNDDSLESSSFDENDYANINGRRNIYSDTDNCISSRSNSGDDCGDISSDRHSNNHTSGKNNTYNAEERNIYSNADNCISSRSNSGDDCSDVSSEEHSDKFTSTKNNNNDNEGRNNEYISSNKDRSVYIIPRPIVLLSASKQH